MRRADFLGRHAEAKVVGARCAIVIHDPILTVPHAACELAPPALALAMEAFEGKRAFSLVSRHGARLSGIPMSTGLMLSVENFPVVVACLAEAEDLDALSAALLGDESKAPDGPPAYTGETAEALRIRRSASQSEGGFIRIADRSSGTLATLLPETGDIVVRDRLGRVHIWPHSDLPDVEWRDNEGLFVIRG